MQSDDRWVYAGPWRKITPYDLGALPTGTVLAFDLDGLMLSMHRAVDGSWRVTPRSIPARLLAGRSARERVRVAQ